MGNIMLLHLLLRWRTGIAEDFRGSGLGTLWLFALYLIEDPLLRVALLHIHRTYGHSWDVTKGIPY